MTGMTANKKRERLLFFRNLLAILAVILTLATIVAGYVAFRDWEKTHAEEAALETTGETVQTAETTAATVSDDTQPTEETVNNTLSVEPHGPKPTASNESGNTGGQQDPPAPEQNPSGGAEQVPPSAGEGSQDVSQNAPGSNENGASEPAQQPPSDGMAQPDQPQTPSYEAPENGAPVGMNPEVDSDLTGVEENK